MLDAKTLPEKFQQVKRQIQQTCQSLKRDPSTVRLMAVSKGQSIEKIRDIFNQGQRDFGENYAQELFHKAEALKGLNIQWHYIGKLQSNKIKKIVNIASSIHTVATLKHAEIIRTHLKIQGISNYPLFISVNISNEPQKNGCSLGEAEALVTQLKGFDELSIQGLMAVPSKLQDPPADQSLTLNQEYQSLKDLTEKLQLQHLSLGMSQDMKTALATGSTWVRVGTGIFGPREPKS